MNPQAFLLENAIFSTRDLAVRCELPIETASRQLKRLEAGKAVVRVTKGVWAQTAHPYYSPYAAVPHLLGNEQGYVSFLTALHIHGVISQIPDTIHVATTGHSRRLRSPIGTFEFFRLHPRMFATGIERSEGRLPYAIATAEKALLDTLYLSSRKGKRFDRLPELDLDAFDEARFKRFLKSQISLEPVRKHILMKWAAVQERYT